MQYSTAHNDVFNNILDEYCWTLPYSRDPKNRGLKNFNYSRGLKQVAADYLSTLHRLLYWWSIFSLNFNMFNIFTSRASPYFCSISIDISSTHQVHTDDQF